MVGQLASFKSDATEVNGTLHLNGMEIGVKIHFYGLNKLAKKLAAAPIMKMVLLLCQSQILRSILNYFSFVNTLMGTNLIV